MTPMGPDGWQGIAEAITQIASEPAEWIASAGFLASVSTAKQAMAALIGTAVASSALTLAAVLLLGGILTAPDMLEEAAEERVEMRVEMRDMDRRIAARILETEARLENFDRRFEQLRCEIIEALRGDLPRDCDQRILR